MDGKETIYMWRHVNMDEACTPARTWSWLERTLLKVAGAYITSDGWSVHYFRWLECTFFKVAGAYITQGFLNAAAASSAASLPTTRRA
eukprot:357911-Chlamydomonas_euryale.AAC.3